jgi:hypothetical protein
LTSGCFRRGHLRRIPDWWPTCPGRRRYVSDMQARTGLRFRHVRGDDDNDRRSIAHPISGLRVNQPLTLVPTRWNRESLSFIHHSKKRTSIPSNVRHVPSPPRVSRNEPRTTTDAKLTPIRIKSKPQYHHHLDGWY